jgi:DNA-binding transcriptional regulator YiaG
MTTKPENPSPAEIIAARKAAKLTQTKAAALVYATCRAWQRWEFGDRKMGPATWELFRIKCPR